MCINIGCCQLGSCSGVVSEVVDPGQSRLRKRVSVALRPRRRVTKVLAIVRMQVTKVLAVVEPMMVHNPQKQSDWRSWRKRATGYVLKMPSLRRSFVLIRAVPERFSGCSVFVFSASCSEIWMDVWFIRVFNFAWEDFIIHACWFASCMFSCIVCFY